MEEVYVGVEKTYEVPAGAETLTVTHEWGDVVVNNEAVAVDFAYTTDSIGTYKFVWKDGDGNVVSTAFYSSVVQLISSEDFFTQYPEHEGAFQSSFSMLERIVRNRIQNYTGQRFGPYVNKSLELQGDGGDSLQLPVRVTALSSVLNNYGHDITEMVEICPNDDSIIQRAPRFRGPYYYDNENYVYGRAREKLWEWHELFDDRYSFTIVGNFGYEYVPTEVSDSAMLLLVDQMTGDDIAEMRQKGVLEVELGDFRVKMNADQWGTTGNATADNLLANYVNFGIGLV